MTGLLIDAREEIWPLKEVFRISRGSRTEARVIVATISDGEHIGRGECVPIARYYQSTESVLALVTAPNAADTRFSSSPERSIATMVFSKVGAAVWFAIASISASC